MYMWNIQGAWWCMWSSGYIQGTSPPLRKNRQVHFPFSHMWQMSCSKETNVYDKACHLSHRISVEGIMPSSAQR